MRFNLLDLFILIFCFAGGIVAVDRTCHALGVGAPTGVRLMAVGIPVGALFHLLFTPPIYRHFRLFPLLLPVCPHCSRLPDGYEILEHDEPRKRVACGRCHETFEVWWRPPAPAQVSKTEPSVVLSWPQSLGRWRRVTGEEPAA
jgi:hypothetical protein